MPKRPDDIMTIEQLAAYLKISQSTLYKLVQDGKLPGRKVGKRRRFHKEAINRWLGERAKSQVPDCGCCLSLMSMGELKLTTWLTRQAFYASRSQSRTTWYVEYGQGAFGRRFTPVTAEAPTNMWVRAGGMCRPG